MQTSLSLSLTHTHTHTGTSLGWTECCPRTTGLF